VNWLIATVGDFSRTTLGTGGFWTLAIEEQYYLLWPAVVLLLPRPALLRTCIGVAVFSMVTRFVMAQMGCSWAAINMATFARFDALAIGAALAIVSRSASGLAPLRRPAWVSAGVAVVGLGLSDLVGRKFHHLSGDVCAMQLGLLPILWASSLILPQTATPSSFISAIMENRLLRSFGKYSYSLYLFHGHLAILPNGMGYQIKDEWVPKILGSVLPAQLLYVIITFAICFGLSWLSWHCYENQFLKLKRYFPSGREAQRLIPRTNATPDSIEVSVSPLLSPQLVPAIAPSGRE
jgi:peptidoglycan/LPS O-acetylase OafA/YrhL